ncbi:MAG: YdcF family protein [Desulfobacteraceae bacterium]|nr:YdcF family protein [Desulfobacteraceae bacterium]
MNTSFYWISKIFWMFFSPDILLLLLLTASLIYLWMKRYKSASKLLSILVFSMIIISILPVGEWLFYPLEKRFTSKKELPESIDGIIVLSGAEDSFKSFLWQQAELNCRSERMFSFIHLANKYPTAKHVFTGGTGSMVLQEYKGTHVAKRLFKDQGLDISKIIFESQSKNTFENAIFTKHRVNPKPNEKWILITSASHMPRSFGVFSKIGWNVIPYPVDHKTHPRNLLRIQLNFSGNLDLLKWAAKEWVGLTAYYLTGKTTHFFPKPSN